MRCLGRRFFASYKPVPRLPLPELPQTVRGYLEAVEPLVSSAEFAATKRRAEALLEPGSEGQRLHEDLKRLEAESPTSWIEGFWDAMYLEARSSVAVDWNPSFVLRDDPHGPFERCERAARLAREATRVHLMLKSGQYPQDFEGSTPLHMLQHEKLFGTARIPQIGRDAVRTDHSQRHIVVLAKGHVYRVDVLTEKGDLVSDATLRRQFHAILRDSEGGAGGADLGALTVLPRDQWASLRSELISSSDALRRYFDCVDRALFVVAFDDVEPVGLDSAAKQMLIGHRSERWFDKWQIVLTPSGMAGFNLEHSPYDGHTFVSMFNTMYANLEKDVPSLDRITSSDVTAFVSEPVVRVDPGPLPKGTTALVAHGRALLAERESSLSLRILEKDWGTHVIKGLKSSPDAFMQLSFQLAWARLHGGNVASTYESGQVKRFLAGRTETIRPVTNESRVFAQQWDSAALSKQQRRALYDAAATKHVERVNVAKTGKGWDRHLFALKCLARQKRQRLPDHFYRIPELFSEDAAFNSYFNIYVSTSNSGALPFRAFSFGPVIPEGIGLGYQTFDKFLSVCCTSYILPAGKYVAELHKAMDDLRRDLHQ